jgi:cellulose biosynthesis protein BcsQ
MNSKIICFSTQKGGGGKSTTTSIFANWLHFVKKKKIVVVDLDHQSTLTAIRLTELNQDPDIDQSSLYTIISCKADEFPQLIENIENDYEYIIVDFPGNISQKDILGCYAYVDTMFVTANYNSGDVSSTLGFVEKMKEVIIPTRDNNDLKTDIYGLFVNVRKNSAKASKFLKQCDAAFGIEFYKRPIYHYAFLEDIQTTENYSHPTYDWYIELVNSDLLNLIEN